MSVFTLSESRSNNNNHYYCKTSIAPISVKGSSSQPQETKSYTGTGNSCRWSMEPPKMYAGKVISNKYVFIFVLRKVPI